MSAAPEPAPAVEEVPLPDPTRDEIERVEDWRYSQLRAAGFSELQAKILSRARHVDLHDIRKLLAAGCSHRKAAMILL